MKSIERMLSSTRNKVITTITSFAIVLAVGFGVYALSNRTINEPKVVFKENIIFEYGHTTNLSDGNMEIYKSIRNGTAVYGTFLSTEIRFEWFINFDDSDFDTISYITFTEGSDTGMQAKAIDTSKPGNNYTRRIFATKGSVTREFEFVYSVEDTQFPVFIRETKDMVLDTRTEYSFVLGTAVDPIDGDVPVTWEGSFDTSTPGEYEIVEVATDKNGNRTENPFKITIKESIIE